MLSFILIVLHNGLHDIITPQTKMQKKKVDFDKTDLKTKESQ